MIQRLFRFSLIGFLLLNLISLAGCQRNGQVFVSKIPVQPGEFTRLLTPAAQSSGPGVGLHIVTDPRIELLGVVQALSGYDKRLHLLTRQQFAYKTDLEKTFAPFRDHQAVALFDQLSAGSFNYDAPPAVMLYLSAPPELEVLTPFPEDLVARAGGPDRLGQWIALLRDFARETQFSDFYAAHADFYRQMTAATASLFSGEDDLALLENYYGMKQHSYTIILAPLFHAGGFGPRVGLADGVFDIYSINGPSGVSPQGLPVFGTSDSFRHLIWHEFAHSFVNPLTTQDWTEVSAYESLFKPIQKDMKAMAYNSWEVSVNEHIVRAVTTRLAARELGEPAGAEWLEKERQQGFRYLDPLLKQLEQYETQREKYPTFSDFYPVLIQAFGEIQ